MRLLALFIVIFGVSLSSAQVSSVKQKLQSMLHFERNILGKFQQQLYFEQDLQDTITGVFVLQKPSDLLWKVEEPYRQITLSDGEQHWLYDIDLEETVVLSSEELESNILLQLLFGEFDILQSFVIVEPEPYYFQLFEYGTDTLLLSLWFQNKKLYRAIAEAGGGEQIHFEFTKVKIDKKLKKKSFFQLKQYQN